MRQLLRQPNEYSERLWFLGYATCLRPPAPGAEKSTLRGAERVRNSVRRSENGGQKSHSECSAYLSSPPSPPGPGAQKVGGSYVLYAVQRVSKTPLKAAENSSQSPRNLPCTSIARKVGIETWLPQPILWCCISEF
jgi:hypothetical protein